MLIFLKKIDLWENARIVRGYLVQRKSWKEMNQKGNEWKIFYFWFSLDKTADREFFV